MTRPSSPRYRCPPSPLERREVWNMSQEPAAGPRPTVRYRSTLALQRCFVASP